jgi:hypothetical protein
MRPRQRRRARRLHLGFAARAVLGLTFFQIADRQFELLDLTVELFR